MYNCDLTLIKMRNKGYAKAKKALNNKIELEQIVDGVISGEISEDVRGSTFGKLRCLMSGAFRLASLRKKTNTDIVEISQEEKGDKIK